MDELFIYDAIGQTVFGGISDREFIELMPADGPITVRINSPGGDVFAGFAIYEALRSHPGEVHVKIDALAASIASVIALAGDTVEIAEAGMMMIHSGWTPRGGNAAELRKTASLLDKVDGNIANIYAKRSEVYDAEQFLEQMLDETWFDATEAADIGFADRVVESDAVAATLKPEHLTLFERPPAQIAAMFQATQKSVKPKIDEESRKLHERTMRLIERGGVKTC